MKFTLILTVTIIACHICGIEYFLQLMSIILQDEIDMKATVVWQVHVAHGEAAKAMQAYIRKIEDDTGEDESMEMQEGEAGQHQTITIAADDSEGQTVYQMPDGTYQAVVTDASQVSSYGNRLVHFFSQGSWCSHSVDVWVNHRIIILCWRKFFWQVIRLDFVTDASQVSSYCSYGNRLVHFCSQGSWCSHSVDVGVNHRIILLCWRKVFGRVIRLDLLFTWRMLLLSHFKLVWHAVDQVLQGQTFTTLQTEGGQETIIIVQAADPNEVTHAIVEGEDGVEFTMQPAEDEPSTSTAIFTAQMQT